MCKKNSKMKKKKRISGGWIFEELTVSSERQTQEKGCEKKDKKGWRSRGSIFEKNPDVSERQKKIIGEKNSVK